MTDEEMQIVLRARDETGAAIKATRARLRELEKDMIEVNRELDKPGNPQRWEQLRTEMQGSQAELVKLKAAAADARRALTEATAPPAAAAKRLQGAFDGVSRRLGITGGAASKLSSAFGRLDAGAAKFAAAWTSAIGRVNARIDTMRAKINASGLVKGFTKALPGMGLVAAGAAAVGIKTASAMEQSQMSFEQLTGSTQKAGEMMDWLKTTAAKTPFELQGLTESTQKLMAYGFTADEAKKKLMTIGDAAAGLGKGQEGVDQVTTALGQMQAKQKISGEEMLQLTEAGIPAWKMLADKMHMTVPALQQMVQTQGGASKLYKKGGLDKLFAGMGDEYGGLMDKQSQTIGGKLSTLKDTVTQGLGDLFGKDMLGPDVKKGIDSLGSLLTGAFNGLKSVIVAIKGPLESVFGFIGAHSAAFKAAAITVGVLTAALWLTNAALGAMAAVLAINPITLIVLAIAAFVALLVEAYQHVDWFRTAVDKAWAGIKVAIAFFVKWFKGYLLPAIKVYLHILGLQFKAYWTVIKLVFRLVVGVIKVAVAIIKGIFAALKADIHALGTAWHVIVEGAKSAWSGVKTAWNAAKSFIAGVVNAIKSMISNIWHGLTDGLSSAVQQVKDTLSGIPGVGSLIGRWAGGPVGPGGTYLVGEIGPELLVTGGKTTWVGERGPEVRTFTSPGFIVPTFAIPDVVEASGPAPELTAVGPRERTEVIRGGDVYVDRIDAREDPAEIERRIARAQARAERIARERAA